MTKRRKHSDTKVEVPHPDIRVSGEKGSPQNKLRGELYSNGFKRMKDAYDKGFYIECIAICDSMITDRLQSYIQFLLHNDDKQFVSSSVFDSLKSLGSATKEKGVRDDEFKVIENKIAEWSSKRNISVHAFVIVVPSTLDKDTETRISNLKDTANEGLVLVREVMKYTSKRIVI